MPSSEMSLPSSSTWAFDASVRAPVPAARSSTVLKPPYSIDTTATTTAMSAATQAVERVSLRAGLPILKTARETMMASARVGSLARRSRHAASNHLLDTPTALHSRAPHPDLLPSRTQTRSYARKPAIPHVNPLFRWLAGLPML